MNSRSLAEKVEISKATIEPERRSLTAEFIHPISKMSITSKLFILNAGGKVQSFELEARKVYSIGRSPMNMIHIRDVHISRYHLRVRFDDNKYYIKDMMSKNGTFVCGEDIEKGVEVEIRKGVPIVIGMTVIGFGEEFESSILPFLLSSGILGEVNEKGELKKPFRLMTVRNNLGCIYNVEKALSKSKDKNEIITVLLNNIFNLLKRIDRCAVIIYDDRREKISKIKYKSRRAGDSPKIALNRDIIMRSLTFNEAVMVRDAYSDESNDENLTKSLRIMKIGSAACVPICTYFNTKGAIYVDSLERPKGFRKNDLAILKDIGTRAALAMDEKEFLPYKI